MKNYAHMHTQIRHCQAQMAVRRRAAPCPADDDQFGTTKTTTATPNFSGETWYSSTSLGVPEYPFGVLEYPLAGLLMQHLVLHPLKRSEKAGPNFTYPFYCIFGWNWLFPSVPLSRNSKKRKPDSIYTYRSKSGTVARAAGPGHALVCVWECLPKSRTRSTPFQRNVAATW